MVKAIVKSCIQVSDCTIVPLFTFKPHRDRGSGGSLRTGKSGEDPDDYFQLYLHFFLHSITWEDFLLIWSFTFLLNCKHFKYIQAVASLWILWIFCAMSDDASKHRDSCQFQFHETDCRPVYIVSGSLGCSGNDYDGAGWRCVSWMFIVHVRWTLQQWVVLLITLTWIFHCLQTCLVLLVVLAMVLHKNCVCEKVSWYFAWNSHIWYMVYQP